MPLVSIPLFSKAGLSVVALRTPASINVPALGETSASRAAFRYDFAKGELIGAQAV